MRAEVAAGKLMAEEAVDLGMGILRRQREHGRRGQRMQSHLLCALT